MMSVCSQSACRKGQRWRRRPANTENRLMRKEAEDEERKGDKWQKSYQTTDLQQVLKQKGHTKNKSEKKLRKVKNVKNLCVTCVVI